MGHVVGPAWADPRKPHTTLIKCRTQRESVFVEGAGPCQVLGLGALQWISGGGRDSCLSGVSQFGAFKKL